MNYPIDCQQELLVLKVHSREEYFRIWTEVEEHIARIAQGVAAIGHTQETWKIRGFCQVCEQEVDFLMDWMFSNHTIPNYRERLLCPTCGLNNRQRFAMFQIKQFLAKHSTRRHKLYLYEQVTPFYSFAKQFIPADVVGSEYLGFDKLPGEVVNGIRHEDAINLSFSDESFHVAVSNDVLEHVPDYQRAIQETCRVLTRPGIFIFTIPFHQDWLQSKPRAKIIDGHIENLLPEQFHGNPLSKQGSLVFHDFGWDLLEQCRCAGFSDAYVLMYHSLLHGYLGHGGQLLFVAEKI
jgi:hypothetical protein